MENENNSTGKKLGSGLVFGKFMPLHNGHVYLIDFAQHAVNKLTILVCSLPSEPIPGEIRYKWVKEMFPNANVIHHDTPIPQEPSEHPDFWNIWKESISKHCPGEEFDCLFGSEDYGWKMAEVMGIQYIPVNRSRNLIPISGTAMRKNPIKHWKHLPKVVQNYYVKKIAIVGPESVGKSTLAKNLAEHFQTLYVEEYGRTILEEYMRNKKYAGGEVHYHDIPAIARGQISSEDALADQANRILICDTELHTTVFWSNYLFGKCPAWVEKEAEKRKYELYLLLDHDVPWVQDGTRIMKEDHRKNSVEWWKKKLDEKKQPYIILKGTWEKRLTDARGAIEKLLETKI
jgi:NadR type nicotinamide-nucleotide adenylyltransferase